MEEKLLEGKKADRPSARGGKRGSRYQALRRYAPLGLLVVLLLLPLQLRESTAVLRILDLIAIYSLLAIGLNVVVGFTGLLVLGYAAFYAVGAYMYAFLASGQFNIHWPFPVLLVVAAMMAAFFGLLLGVPVLRLRGDYLAIVTLGFGEIVRIFINNLTSVTNGPQGISLIDSPNLFGLELSTPTHIYYLLLVLLALVILAVRRMENSRIGRAWAAIREDEGAALAMGVNTTRLKLMAFAFSASIAGVAGVIFAGLQGFVSPESFTFWESIQILSMVVLGGIGSIPGTIIGATALVGVPELLRQYADYRVLGLGVIMIMMMIFRPQGVWPSRILGAELRAGREEEAEGPAEADEQEAAGMSPAEERVVTKTQGGS